MVSSAQQFARAAVAAGLISAQEFKAFWNSLPAPDRPKDAAVLASAMVAVKLLTGFQASVLLSEGNTPLVLGDYVVLNKIGAGGMGQVFQARHRRMERLVAIKLLPPSLSGDEDSILRFHREVRAAAKLLHPNIVTAFDAGESQGQHYLVMEYVEGEDLAALLNRQSTLPVTLAVNYVRQAAKGLAYAHGKGVIHRDIKPANLLLDEEGTIKILDMGLARLDDASAGSQSGLTVSGQVMGTVDYMAPEQAFDVKSVDGRADIYSLGCTLYRLLTGRNLYTADTLIARLTAHQTHPIPSVLDARSDMPVRLDAVLRRMVAKAPQDRQPSMTQLYEELAEFDIEGSPASIERSLSGSKPSGSGHTVAEVNPTLVQAKAEPNGHLQAVHSADAPTLVHAAAITDTSEVPDESIEATRSLLTSAEWPPWSRPHWPLTVAGAAAFFLILLTIWIIIKDRNGKEIARIQVPDGGEVIRVDIPDSAEKSRAVEPVELARSKKAWEWPLPVGYPQPLVAPCDANTARQSQQAWAAHLKCESAFTNSLGMKFALVPPAEVDFRFAPVGEREAGYVDSTIRMRIPQPYFVGTTEVSRGAFQKFVEETNYVTDAERNGKVMVAPSFNHQPGYSWKKPGWEVREDEPITFVSKNDATAFAEWLSKKEGLRYRLPNEAEWRLAATAGDDSFTGTKSWGPGTYAPPVPQVPDGKKSPLFSVESLDANPLGLFHVLGNVAEFSGDDWGSRAVLLQALAAPAFCERASEFGGHWAYDQAAKLSLNVRWRREANESSNILGFRLLCELPEVKDMAPEGVSKIWIQSPTAGGGLTFVAAPEKIKGLRSWTIDTRAARFMPAAIECTEDSVQWVDTYDGTIRKFDSNGQLKKITCWPGTESYGGNFSHDKKLLVVMSREKIAIIELATGKVKMQFWCSSGPRAVAISKSNKNVAVLTPQYLHVIALDDPAQPKIVTFPAVVGDAYRILWSPDDKALWQISPSGGITAQSWPAREPLPIPDALPKEGLEGFGWSPDGKLFQTFTKNSLQVFDTTTWKEVHRQAITSRQSYPRWSPDSQKLMCQIDGKVQVWSSSNWSSPRTLPLNFQSAFTWSADSQFVVAGERNRPRWFSVEDGSEVNPYQGSKDGVFESILCNIAASPDGQQLAIASGSSIQILDPQTAQPLKTYERHGFSQVWSPTGKWLADFSYYPTKMHLFLVNCVDGQTHQVQQAWPVQAVAWSPDETRLVSIDQSNFIKIWSVPEGRLVKSLEYPGTYADVAWSPDGKQIAVRLTDKETRTGSQESELVSFDASTLSIKAKTKAVEYTNESVRAPVPLKWSPDSQSIVTAFGRYLSRFQLQKDSWKASTLFDTKDTSYPVHGFDYRSSDGLLIIETHGYTKILFPGKQVRYLELCGRGKVPTWYKDTRGFFSGLAHFGKPMVAFDAAADEQLGVIFASIGDKHWLCIGPTGHYLGSPGVENDIVYIAEHLDGSFTTHTPAEFASTYSWKNDANQGTFLARPNGP